MGLNNEGLGQSLLNDNEEDAATPGALVDESGDGRESPDALKRGFTAFDAGPPEDANNLVYVCMLVIGVGVLLPWNAVITAVDYYSATYSFVANNIETYISAAFTTPCVLVLFLMLRFGNSISITKRVVTTFILCTVGLVLLPVVAIAIPCDSCRYNADFNSSEANPTDVQTSCYISLGVTIFLCFFVGMCANILQFSAFGFGSILPPVYTQALMAGNGIAGVVILILSILTSVVYQCNPQNTTGLANYTICTDQLANKRSSAYIYFALGGVILVICTILYLWIVRQPFTQYHMDNADMGAGSSNSPTSPKHSKNVGKQGELQQFAGDEHEEVLDFPDTSRASTAPLPVTQVVVEKPLPRMAFSNSPKLRDLEHYSGLHRDEDERRPSEDYFLSSSANESKSAGPDDEILPARPARVLHRMDNDASAGTNERYLARSDTHEVRKIEDLVAYSGKGRSPVRSPESPPRPRSNSEPDSATVTRATRRKRALKQFPDIHVDEDTAFGNHFSMRKFIQDVQEAVGIAADVLLGGREISRSGSASSGLVAAVEEIAEDKQSPGFCSVAGRISPLAAQVYLCFTTTILLFPAVTVLIPYDNSMGWFNAIFGGCEATMDTWWISLLLLMFNLFDLCGRMTAKYKSCTKCFNSHTLWILTLGRLAFIPLFFFSTGVHSGTGTPIFSSYVVLLIMALFAFTNGYNGSLCMMFAPAKVEPQLMEKAGFLMSFCLQAGILSGSYGAIPVTHALHISL